MEMMAMASRNPPAFPLLVPGFSDTRMASLELVARAPDERISLAVSSVFIFVYFANLVYTLVTHRDAFAFEEDQSPPRGRFGHLWRFLGWEPVFWPWRQTWFQNPWNCLRNGSGYRRFLLALPSWLWSEMRRNTFPQRILPVRIGWGCL